MATNKINSVTLLPEFLRTERNSKFLSSTIDQLIQPPQLERINGYVGSTQTPTYNSTADIYLSNGTPYQLDPALILRDNLNNITDTQGYDDLINEISVKGGYTNNLDRLFRSEVLSYNPHIDWDKLVNYQNYFWVPEGPELIDIVSGTSTVINQVSATVEVLTPTGTTSTILSNGMLVCFNSPSDPEEFYDKTFYVEGVGSSIKLVPFKPLLVSESFLNTYPDGWDTHEFDNFPFDNDREIPIIPEYVTINRASNDSNSWSRYNRWVHKDVIRLSAQINGREPTYISKARAQRPIVEFVPNIKLLNFGSIGIEPVDIFDKEIEDISTINNSTSTVYLDGIELEEGHRIIFSVAEDPAVVGKIYEVKFVNVGSTRRLTLIPSYDTNPPTDATVVVLLGVENNGTEWWYNGTEWVYGQQRISINQAPLFDLYDVEENSYGNKDFYLSDFAGNKIFSYAVGTGTPDPYLGFPIKYKNSTVIGGIVFENNLSTDSIVVSQLGESTYTILSNVGYVKIGNEFKNAWVNAVEYPIPVLSSTATGFINYYEEPLSLTNNPLNGVISEFTISELTDHVDSMVERMKSEIAYDPLTNKLRDQADYTKYGIKLISNINPVSFAQMFVGKKEHSVVDSIIKSANKYNKFKLSFLNGLNSVTEQLTPSDAVDEILLNLNKSTTGQAPYYYSDMLPYGTAEVNKVWTVTNPTNVLFPLLSEFDLTTLSTTSVLVYLNGLQLIYGIDYVFNKIESTVELLVELSIDDVVLVKEFQDTTACYVPPTPTKLGLYPKYIPSMYYDDTYASGSVKVIQGHDGSITLAYNDYRDAIILELEKRIFNNIKSEYRPELLDINSVIPGIFRETDYNIHEVNGILESDFVRWSTEYVIDYADNQYFDPDDSRTWNFAETYNSFLDEKLFGSWRLIFKQFYDTDRPHTHPWEMIGYSIKPDWWEGTYGQAPYTSSNVVWADMEMGYDTNSDTINDKYARPGLSNVLPVDSFGNLIDPTVLISGITDSNKRRPWQVGDLGPAETAWRRSSYYPFAVQRLLALTKPASYSSLMFDVSRVKKNISNQWVYGNDETFLKFKNLYINGENNNLTSGYSVFVSETGEQRSVDYLKTLRQDLSYASYNLFFKVGGFIDKDSIQVIIDAYAPSSTSPGAILPAQNYQLRLNAGNPIKSIGITGLIIQKVNNEYVIKGYDTQHPFFTCLTPIRNLNTPSFTVGGETESYVVWEESGTRGATGLSAQDTISASAAPTGNFYQKGQNVFYGNNFYKVTVAHRAGSSFNPAYFQLLPKIPTIGGVTVQTAASFNKTETLIPYGVSYSNVQDVYDLIIGYGQWLTKQGFIFDDYNEDLESVMDWSMTAKEFLYWTTQNWASGSIITLSPFADRLVYKSTDSVVNNVFDEFYDYSILRADGTPFPKESLSISRLDGTCLISTFPNTDGIYNARLNLVRKEHAIIFDNETIFGDTVYNVETGDRQRRIKLVGFRTAGWNGDYFSPGFVYDTAIVKEWERYQSYNAGSTVRFGGNYYSALKNVPGSDKFEFTKWNLLRNKPTSGLLPNFDYKIKQFEDFYSTDSDNFDEAQQQLSQHLVGYTPRVYFNNVFSDPIAQFKFYQGYIKDKGSNLAISKLSKASLETLKGDISYNEEWAFRVGNFGSFPTYEEIEFPLVEGTFRENPQIIHFVNSVPNNSENTLLNYVVPSNLTISPNNYNSENTFLTTSTDLKLLLHSGYVRIDDVTATAYNENSLLDIANSNQLKDGNTIWLGFKEDGGWDVFRYTYVPAAIIGVYVSAPVEDITFTTQYPHGLSIGELIGVNQFNEQVNGIYRVKAIPSAKQFTVASTLSSIENAPLESPGQLFVFSSVRFSDFDVLPSDKVINRLPYGTKFWVDATEAHGWEVYQKTDNYDSTSYFNAGLPLAPGLGKSISKRKGSDIVVVGAPNNYRGTQYGVVWVYDKTETGELKPVVKYRLGGEFSDQLTGFGNVIVYDDFTFTSSTYGLVFVGAPLAYSSQGVVKVSSINSKILTEGTSTYISSPDTTLTNFGSSIFVERNTSTKTVLVGADNAVYSYVVKDLNGTISVSQPNRLLSTSTYSISGADNGSYIAIGGKQKVYIFNKALNLIDTLTSRYASFGKTVAMSQNGDYLFVSIPEIINVDESLGQVLVYKNINGKFIYNQTLENPVQGLGMTFGKAMDVTVNADTLVISALGVNHTFPTTFDKGTTIFDAGVTDFTGTEANSGAVYVYCRENERFILSQEVTDPFVSQNYGTNYGTSIVVDDNSVLVGCPSLDNPNIKSGFFKFDKIDTTTCSLKKIRYQEDQVDLAPVQKIVLIDTEKEQVIDYLDVVDPLKGRIAGIAEQELTYKLINDPAIYSIGIAGVNVDTAKNWMDEKVGELWWDLSTAKYIWYEQSTLDYRKNNWGRLFPGATIDVYEWVRTPLLPTEWSAIADTPAGLTSNVSGQPKFADNSVISVKQIYDNVTNSFSNVYYYWVKNKVLVPDVAGRRISCYEVGSIIADPTAYGLKFASIISKDAVSLSNIGSIPVDDKISLNISRNLSVNSLTPLKHTEWLLLQENSANNMPPLLLEKKMIDSILGHDRDGRVVPDIFLTDRTKYGIGVRPQQTMFKNRVEALRNVVEFANSILITEPITGNYSFKNLNKQEEIPDRFTNEYDDVVEDNSMLEDINTSTFVRAIINCTVSGSGEISDVSIANPGAGYGTLNPVYSSSGTLIGYQGPTFTDFNYDTLFDSGTTTFNIGGATSFLGSLPSPYGKDLKITTVVNEQGSIISASVLHAGKGYKYGFKLIARPHTIIVESDDTYNGKWTRYEFDYITYKWNRAHTQSFNTTLYWDYVDWVSTEYNKFKVYSSVIGSPYELSELDSAEGEYVKINNSGDGRYIVIEKGPNDIEGTYGNGYNLVYKEKGTVQIKNSIWDTSNSNLNWDKGNTYDETLWDQTPDLEIQYIFDALKYDIFINKLKVNWNLLFFTSVRYALTEQKILDWAFKTSFITVVNNAGNLGQPPVYKIQDSIHYENYINEVKPYHTQVRNFVTNHSILEPSNTEVSELDRTASIKLKFDRITSAQETEDFVVNDLFVASGVDNEFILSWVPDANKLKITVKIDKIRVLSSKYTIVYYSEPFNGYNKKFAKLVFLDELPIDANKVISIEYKKSAEVLNATDRVLSYYTATSGMVGLDLGMLMYGIDYPGPRIGGQYEGIGFNTPYGGTYPSSYISAGTWTNGILSTALGINPEERIIDGGIGFLSPSSGFAPEEVVPGFAIDSLGISVYTQGPAPGPTVYSENFSLTSGNGLLRYPLPILPPTIASMTVIFNGVYFNYTEGLLNPGTSVYSIDWENLELLVPDQDVSGDVGYTIIGVGGSETNVGLIDYEVNYTSNTSTAVVESFVAYNVVQDAFVSVNGTAITTSTSVYYDLTYDNVTGKAVVTVRNLTNYQNAIQVWFFGETKDLFNKVRDQSFVYNGSTTTFTLLYPPEIEGPDSTHVIVDLISNGVSRRLLPSDDNLPGIYDYIVTDNQITIYPSASLTVNDTIKVITFSNHDSMAIRVDKFVGVPNRRFVLDRPVLNDKYIWVTINKFNGIGVPPTTVGLINGIDFTLFEDDITVQLGDDWPVTVDDIVEIRTMVAPTHPTNILGYRIFNDMLGGTTFTRLSLENSTKLTQILLASDTEIHVEDASVFTPPSVLSNIPGVALIDGERIEFFEIDGNILKQLTRGTMGTGPADYVNAGTRVFDQGTEQIIPSPENTFIQNTFTNTLTNVYPISLVDLEITFPDSNDLVRCDGIQFSSDESVLLIDQVEVYYGGYQLRKSGKYFLDTSVSYDGIDVNSIVNSVSTVDDLATYTPNVGDAFLVTSTNKVWVYTGTRSVSTSTIGWIYSGVTYLPPEFSITTSSGTNLLVLNTATIDIVDGIQVTLIKKDTTVEDSWNTVISTGTTLSLIDSTTPVAEFLKTSPTILPKEYFNQSQDNVLRNESGQPLLNEASKILTGNF